jgi:tRNA(Ile)-lysidine synthase
MSLLNQFISFVSKENLFSPKDKLLLAVSGGVDSVVLCELCKQAGYDFVIAHCNFKLRGAESERDKEFVQQLAKKYNVSFHLNEFDTTTYAASKKISIQEAARELRYHWFNELIQKGEAKYIVTAHHLDDNIETMVMHFFRGTGIYGLRGMLPKQQNIVRPLLFAKKDALKEFAATQQLPFVEDSSNSEDKYTRNFFRNQLLPMVQEIFPRAEQNLAHNLQRFAETEILYKQALDLRKKKLLEPKGNEVHIPALKLKKVAPLHTITYEIIKDYGFSPQQTGEVIALLDSESGKYVQSPSHRIIKNRNWLIITPLQSKQADNILVENADTQIEFQLGRLILKNANSAIPDSSLVAALDSRNIQFPLLLRKWKQGDYFYPLGMPGKKKLARFFIDQKLSLADKEKVWVLESNKKILWVVGMRIDDRFKITGSTKSVLKIELKATTNTAVSSQ